MLGSGGLQQCLFTGLRLDCCSALARYLTFTFTLESFEYFLGVQVPQLGKLIYRISTVTLKTTLKTTLRFM